MVLIASRYIYHAYQVCDRFVVISHGAVLRAVRKEDTSLEELTAMIMTH